MTPNMTLRKRFMTKEGPCANIRIRLDVILKLHSSKISNCRSIRRGSPSDFMYRKTETESVSSAPSFRRLTSDLLPQRSGCTVKSVCVRIPVGKDKTFSESFGFSLPESQHQFSHTHLHLSATLYNPSN
jgi:hypothetical protein